MLLSPTGGLIYHLRAWRSSHRMWAPFRSELGAWLRDWEPREEALLMIGPSGGYCLEPRFLERFKRLAAVDPDPLAARIFQYRLQRKVAWTQKDYFTPQDGRFKIARIHELLAAHPGHAVLFCNFLGQLPLLDPLAALGESYLRWKRELPAALKGRSWASFHDRLSGDLQPTFQGCSEIYRENVSDEGVIDALYPEPTGTGEIELTDHLTGDLFPGYPRRFFSWELKRGTWHLIEAVHS